MRTAILYGSTHGRTRRVVARVEKFLATSADAFDVKEIQPEQTLQGYDLLLFFCPTYGDEELQEDMEAFLLGFDGDLRGKLFVICELGSYYGYDDFSFGAMRIIRAELLARNATELCEPLSLDSFPRMNETHLIDWIGYLNGKINEQIGLSHA
jgi:flavodoxin